MSHLRGAAVAAIVVLLAASGCQVQSDRQKQDEATVLTMATAAGPESRAASQIQEFARHVATLSSGDFRIEPMLKAAAEEADAWNQAVAQSTEGGDFDMALIPTRTWASEGIPSFDALSAPFLIASDELVSRVVSPDIASGMLDDLKQIGVTGLALLPDSQRRLFSFTGPVFTPADLAGKVVRAPRSATTYATLSSLGAMPRALTGDLFAEALASGTVQAAESSFARAESFPRGTTTTGNLPLYPKINTLVVNTVTFGRLTANEQRILKEAASRTREAAAGAMHTAAEASAYCQKGGTIVNATEQQVAAFVAAVGPVYAQLAKDPSARALIEEVRTFSRASKPDPIAACGPGGHTSR
ncbi:TRAP-type C4-dicarboxylate transport system substrate-binding protein [Arthrobacter globiformis]|uniref:TRAP transporter substrate-binding protein n=1 Tax=Arthrobacter globiformis TaxID=1665 RepID=UPI0027837CA2|nr:TRAP transporter substrate-binding protein DctP [Arthrobacter globiformis]MDQ1059876.1 TRAP-type C4-dicarboxylate transport system substrate-binding protein [Arthrobacter globiformis]